MSAALSRRRLGAGLRTAVAALGGAAALAVAVGALAHPAFATQPIAVGARVIAGPAAPGSGPTALSGSIARDGTGALVFLAPVGGVQHVYVSALLNGAFLAPVRVDGALAGASSEPQVAAGPGGALVVAFLNAGSLYVAGRRSAFAALAAPHALAAGAGNLALAMSPFGKTYLAFTVADGAGTDVRVAFQGAAGWGLEPGPLNVARGDDAGTGAGHPAVTAAGDGVGIVAWGEGGHVFTRRVWGTVPSVVTEQADAPLPGCTEGGAGEPAIGAGGDSSYAAVAFQESVTCHGQTVARVLVNRLRGSRFAGEWPADGALGAGGATRPAVAVGEYGTGWVTSQTAAQNVAAMPLGDNETDGTAHQLNALPDASPPDTVAAMAGLYATVIAWQHDPGAGAAPDIRARYADTDQVPGPEIELSSPAGGPSDAAAGLAAGGDIAGDAVVAWVQSTPAGDELLATQLYRAPGAPTPTPPPPYVRSPRPTLAWAASQEAWGPVRYTVSLDGVALGQTSATSITVPAALAQGRHTWQVTATNVTGQTSGPQAAAFFIDSLAPALTVSLGPNRLRGRVLTVHAAASDDPPPLPAAATSGMAAIIVRWGDGTVTLVRHHLATHVYLRPGRYRITVLAVDHAGNATTRTVPVRITAPRPGHRPRPGHG